MNRHERRQTIMSRMLGLSCLRQSAHNGIVLSLGRSVVGICNTLSLIG